MGADVGYLMLGLAGLLLVVPVIWWVRRGGRDEVFTGITPGELPGIGHQAGRARVGGGEYSGPYAVRFTPPDRVTPGLVGVVIDGRADPHDLGATIVDLAVRGHYSIRAVEPGPDEAAGSRSTDYVFTRAQVPPTDRLHPYEQILLDGLFARGPVARLSGLGETFAQRMREAIVALYREVVDRRWYTGHPAAADRRVGCWLGALYVLAALGLAAVVWHLVREYAAGPAAYALPGLLLVGAALLLRLGRRRSPRTAEGSAVRVQTLGFRQYLSTAEANQLRFEEGLDVFSRYLPYAIVFGVAQRWARMAAEILAVRPDLAAQLDLGWLDIVDVLDVGAGLLDGVGDLVDLGSQLTDLPDLLGGLGDLLGGLAEGAGEVASGVGDLLSNAADGCSGCDLPGCDFP